MCMTKRFFCMIWRKERQRKRKKKKLYQFYTLTYASFIWFDGATNIYCQARNQSFGVGFDVRPWHPIWIAITSSTFTVVCILVWTASFPRFWRNHSWCTKKWYLIWMGCFFSLDEAKKKKNWKKKIKMAA